MDEKDQYSPEVYKRLELVKKQFERDQAERRKQQAAEHKRERRQKVLGSLAQNKVKIGRIVVYTLLGAILLSVITVAIRGAWS
jgi:hypothetical protein